MLCFACVTIMERKDDDICTTYRSGDEESRKEIPSSIKGRCDDGRNVVIGSDRHNHHAIEGEVQ